VVQIISATGSSFEVGDCTWMPRRTQSLIRVITNDAEVRRAALPQGFRFLIKDDMSVIEPVLFYLHEKCVMSARIQAVGNTQRAYCDDLYEWWMWLGELKKEWTEVDTEDLIRYRDTLLTEFSSHTHRRYKSKTVRRRLSTILGFYRWANDRDLVSDNLDRRQIRPIRRPTDERMFAHVHSRAAAASVSEILPRVTEEEPINAFAIRELQQVLNALGAMPPVGEEARQDPRPVRDRLVAVLQLATGMRIDEVLSLTKYQILDLRPRSDDPYASVKLKIVKTKGLRPRNVLLPHLVLDALHWYIDHERAEAVAARKRTRPESRRAAEVAALFVNGIHANSRDVGNAFRPTSFMRAFAGAVSVAGLVHRELHRDPVTGEDRMATVVDHTSQDLRHTFATQTYLARKAMGDAEPWKTLQALLGHKQLATTINIYLRSVTIDEAQITDSLGSFFRELRGG
jgi:site-specific recombinase XerD